MTEESKINLEELKSVIQEKSDFSFEMKILKLVRDNKYKATHSGTYLDPYTKLNREYDIRATKIICQGKQIKLAVECKNFDPAVPVVIHSVQASSTDWKHGILVEYSKLIDQIIKDKEERSTFPTMPNPMQYMWDRISSHEVKHRKIDNNVFHSIYSKFEYIGKSLDKVNIKKKGQDKGKIYFDDSEIYSKYSQAINSLCDLILECDNGTDYPVTQSLVLPVLVIPNKSLFEVRYDDDGEIISGPAETDRVPFYIHKNYDSELGKNFPEHSIPYLEIVTESGLQALLNELQGDADFDHQPSFLGENELNKVVIKMANKFLS